MATELVAQLRLRLVDEVSGEARRVESAMKLATGGISAGVEQLRLKQLDASTAARTLQNELRRLQASGTATQAEIQEVASRLVRAREAAAGFAAEARELAAAERAAAAGAQQLASAQRAASVEASRGAVAVTRGADDVARASKAQTRGMAEAVNMASEMALGFGGLSPTVRELSIGLAMGGNNAVVMANAMGPLGIVLGVATGILPQLITMLSRSGDEMESLEERTARAAQTFRDLVDAIRQVREEGEREDRAARGELSVEEQEDELKATQTRLREARRQEREARDVLERREGAERNARIRAIAEQAAQTEGFARMSPEARSSVINRAIAAETARGGRLGMNAPEAFARVINIAEARQTLLQRQEVVGEREGQERAAQEALDQARAREEREAQERETRDRPQRLREQLSALATTAGLTQQQSSRLMQSAERGRLDQSLLGRLGGQGARAQQLVEQLRAAEVARAQLTLDEGRATDTMQGLEPTTDTAAVVQRVRRARAPLGAGMPTTPGAPGTDWGSIARSLERLASGEQRVRVDVRVDDERVRADVADASAPDLTGGQR